ncbi:MAG: hypothetical protein K1W40_03375, partial [Schaedlerella sp.]|uniref:hypothetical protein n=1 Tax=Schaedlerella sp. TaxID=2676057 RepID=UPI003526E0E1
GQQESAEEDSDRQQAFAEKDSDRQQASAEKNSEGQYEPEKNETDKLPDGQGGIKKNAEDYEKKEEDVIAPAQKTPGNTEADSMDTESLINEESIPARM